LTYTVRVSVRVRVRVRVRVMVRVRVRFRVNGGPLSAPRALNCSLVKAVVLPSI